MQVLIVEYFFLEYLRFYKQIDTRMLQLKSNDKVKKIFLNLKKKEFSFLICMLGKLKKIGSVF